MGLARRHSAAAHHGQLDDAVVEFYVRIGKPGCLPELPDDGIALGIVLDHPNPAFVEPSPVAASQCHVANQGNIDAMAVAGHGAKSFVDRVVPTLEGEQSEQAFFCGGAKQVGREVSVAVCVPLEAGAIGLLEVGRLAGLDLGWRHFPCGLERHGLCVHYQLDGLLFGRGFILGRVLPQFSLPISDEELILVEEVCACREVEVWGYTFALLPLESIEVRIHSSVDHVEYGVARACSLTDGVAGNVHNGVREPCYLPLERGAHGVRFHRLWTRRSKPHGMARS